MFERRLAKHAEALSSQYPILTIMGPRQSGKTTLARSVFPDLPYASLEDPDVREFALADPRGFLAQYEKGAIFDEIQRTPDLPSYLQGMVDNADRTGMYVLTGSQNITLSQSISQSLAGRTAVLTLLPLSLSETGFSPANPSKKISHEIFNGYYPRLRKAKGLSPTQYYSDYFQTYVQRDIRDLAQIRDISLFERFLRLCAGRVGRLLNIHSLAGDAGVARGTAENWLGHLEASYLVFRLQPFYKNLGKRLVKSPKLYFHDVGLAAYLLGIKHIEHIPTHPLKGSLFENLVIADLLKQRYHEAKMPDLYFYRDSNHNEVDCIREMGNRYELFEIKSRQTVASDFFDGIQRFKKALKPPSEVEKSYVVYGGDRALIRRETEVTTLAEVAAIF